MHASSRCACLLPHAPCACVLYPFRTFLFTIGIITLWKNSQSCAMFARRLSLYYLYCYYCIDTHTTMLYSFWFLLSFSASFLLSLCSISLSMFVYWLFCVLLSLLCCCGCACFAVTCCCVCTLLGVHCCVPCLSCCVWVCCCMSLSVLHTLLLILFTLINKNIFLYNRCVTHACMLGDYLVPVKCRVHDRQASRWQVLCVYYNHYC